MTRSVLTDDVRAALTTGRLAHLTTINPDGSPQVSVVWIGLDGDDIVVGHLMGGRKVTNIARDPRVALTGRSSRRQPGRHGQLPDRARHRPPRRGRCARAVAAPGRDLHRSGCEVPALR